MTLQAITPSVCTATLAMLAADAAEALRPCSFCGARSGRWQTACAPSPPAGAASGAPIPGRACPLCTLPQHLERPRIDDEVALVWLPEMSQALVNATMREIHMQLRSLGEALHAGARLRTRCAANRTLHFGRAVMSERAAAAASRVGTGSPRELGAALSELSPAAYGRRGALLGGLRFLPLGRFYDGDTDVYPDIVQAWLRPAHHPEAAGPPAAGPVSAAAASLPPRRRKLFRRG